MPKELTDSIIDRRNILNNPFAIAKIQDAMDIQGVVLDNQLLFTLENIADFYEVDVRTIDRYLARFADELKSNGYEVLAGEGLRRFKQQYVSDISVANIAKAPLLGVFNFKALLNLGFLLKESDKAQVIRSIVLNIIIAMMTEKAGGNTKYINQREDDFIITMYAGEVYRKEFTGALNKYVDMGPAKYAIYTNKIYKSIFKEHANEYKAILSLSKGDKVRDTMYSEVLTTISMYETGLADHLKSESERRGRKLSVHEADQLFANFERNPAFKPQIEVARRKMASRDYGLRDALHPQLSDYIGPIDVDDFERFLGEKSADLAQQIQQHKDVFQRLKEK